MLLRHLQCIRERRLASIEPQHTGQWGKPAAQWYWWRTVQEFKGEGNQWRCNRAGSYEAFLGQVFPHILSCSFFLKKLSSVQFSHSVVSDSLRPHESQHAGPPCPSPSPGVHSDSRSSSPWCHPAISSSVVPFSSCPQCLPTSESFPMSQLFAWGGQSTGVSALASLYKFSPVNSCGLYDRLSPANKLILKHSISKSSLRGSSLP